MTRYDEATIIANGLRTDHPLPGLPFVDDRHLPLNDPAAIEALGRRPGTDMWGRFDRHGDYWKAFTTDPTHPQFAWVVTFHPDHGRTVVLALDSDAADLYSFGVEGVVALRFGGYWWDGITWHRPLQRFDWVLEKYESIEVDDATTITARDLLPRAAPISRPAPPQPVAGLTAGRVVLQHARWEELLASVWATHRPADGLPLECCAITLEAPELEPTRLLGTPQAAAAAGISESTLRSYLVRGDADAPAPQLRGHGGRTLWSRPVIEDWVARRRSEPAEIQDRVTQVSPLTNTNLAPGIADLLQRTSETVQHILENHPSIRRTRKDADLSDLATQISWRAFANPDTLASIVPINSLQDTAAAAVTADLTYELRQSTASTEKPTFTTLSPWTSKSVWWLLRVAPTATLHMLQRAIGDVLRTTDLDRGYLRAGIIHGLSPAQLPGDDTILDLLREQL